MTDRPYSNWEGLPFGWTPQSGLETLRDVLNRSCAGDRIPQEPNADTRRAIVEVGLAITALLLYKNERYGNSALAPIEVFAQGLTPRQRMAVRMDDKLNRLKNGLGTKGGDGEHPGIDLAGYLLLDIIAEWEERSA